MLKKNLVVHVPHASIYVPDSALNQFTVDPNSVQLEAHESADLYTDLIAQAAWPHANIICAKVSRIVVDVERYIIDTKEEMSQVGRGVIYTHDHNGRSFRKKLDVNDRKSLIANYYKPHWRRLKVAARGAVLIDLHTYPKDPWKIERRPSDPRPEIDLGFEKITAPMDWINDLTKHFRECGYDVAHNTPYSGVIEIGAAAAVMIEIRRDVVGEPNSPQWDKLIHALGSIPLPLPIS